MTERSRFWNGTTPGDAGPYSFADFIEVMQFAAAFGGDGSTNNNDSVLLGSGDGVFEPLSVVPASPAAASVRIAVGRAMVQGLYYENDAFLTKAIAANASGNPRIDTIVLQAQYGAVQTVRVVVKQGTPAASPVAPTLTQSAGVTWEAPLADVAVANAFSSISAANITNYPQYANMQSLTAHDAILNNSGVTLVTGDAVIWDVSLGGRAVKKTTVANDPKIAGIWVGITPNGSLGRMAFAGIAYVRVNGATPINSQLVTSTTAGQAKALGSGEKNTFGVSLAATAGAGLVLASLNIYSVPANFHSGFSVQRSSFGMTGSLVDVVWTSENYDTDAYTTVGNANITIPITGRYLFTGAFTQTGASGGNLGVQILVNGGSVVTFSGDGSSSVSVAWILSLTATDIVTFKFRNTGSPAGNASGQIQGELLTS